ncbi:MAG: hypothetical protein K1X89_17810 [Myxococcaceae bacterium]|nr:hypothetical protein [Myxococcaceae bacterium]
MRRVWWLSVALAGCLDLDPAHYVFACQDQTCAGGGGGSMGGGSGGGVAMSDGGTDGGTDGGADAGVDAGIVAFDRFLRSETRGLGRAEVGGAWTTVYGASNMSVDAGLAFFNLPAPTNSTSAALTEISARDVELTVQLSVDKVADGSGTYNSLMARRQSATKTYAGRVRLNQTNAYLSITKLDGTTNDTAIVAEKPMSVAATAIALRFRVEGANPTTLRLRAWPADAGEPSTWDLVGSDATPELQDAGHAGLTVYLSGSATNAPVLTTFRTFTVKGL